MHVSSFGLVANQNVAVLEDSRFGQVQAFLIYAIEQFLSAAEYDGIDDDLELVDETGVGELRHDCTAAENSHAAA